MIDHGSRRWQGDNIMNLPDRQPTFNPPIFVSYDYDDVHMQESITDVGAFCREIGQGRIKNVRVCIRSRVGE